jgi:hypothetical protein
VTFRAGTLKVGEAEVPTVAVDPSTYRAFAAEGTAEATAGVADGRPRRGRHLARAGQGPVAAARHRAHRHRVRRRHHPLRLGALATTACPAPTSSSTTPSAQRSAWRPGTGVLLSARTDQDPKALADEVRAIAGDAAVVDLLRAPAANPVAFLTGSKAAQAFGKFSYRYFPDGTIQPDEAWVRENIVTTTVPIMGRVTCHKLMVPQLRGALQEVVDAGLAAR